MELSTNPSPKKAARARFAAWYDRYIARWLPRYALLSLPCCLLGTLLYEITNRLIANATPVNIMSSLDAMIPLRMEWILVYFGCYITWGLNFWLVARRGRERWFRFLAANAVAIVVCAVIFVAFPCTMTRPEITGEGLFPWLMRLLYASDQPVNLLPSLHCYTSWMCAIGIHSDRRVPLWYRVFSYVCAFLVFASTLFVRQHCIVDIFAGVALAQAVYLLFRRGNAYRPLARVFDRLERLVFGECEIKNG